MEIGMCIFDGMTIEKQVELMKKHNIKRTFIESEAKDFDSVMKLFSENGIICETLHAPYDKINDMYKSGNSGEEILARLKDGIDKCNKYGIGVLIVHLSSKCPMPEINEFGIERFDKLYEYAKEKNVTLAYENQRYWENLEFMLKRHEKSGFCWDTGHEAALAVDKSKRAMSLFGSRLVALHIHDNCTEANCDDHVLPLDGKIDFKRNMKELADSGYKGTLMLEIRKNATYLGKKIYENMTDEEYFLCAIASAEKLLALLKAYK